MGKKKKWRIAGIIVILIIGVWVLLRTGINQRIWDVLPTKKQYYVVANTNLLPKVAEQANVTITRLSGKGGEEIKAEYWKDTSSYHALINKRGIYKITFELEGYSRQTVMVPIRRDEIYVVSFVADDPTITKEYAPDYSNVVSFNNHYYSVYSMGQISDWDSAARYTSALGGYLATITSEEENQFLYDYIRSRGFESAYFGLTDFGEEGNWRWANGERVTYINWAEGEPSNENGRENYGMYYSAYTNGEWNDGPGVEYDFAFICEWDDLPGGYENTWTEQIAIFNGHAYAYFDVLCSWEEAEDRCEALGGHLATITSEEEQSFVASSSLGSSANYWLGATDAAEEGVWSWVTNEEWSYTNWCAADGQPDNYLFYSEDGEDFLEYVVGKGQWNDRDGRYTVDNHKIGYICEWDDSSALNTFQAELQR